MNHIKRQKNLAIEVVYQCILCGNIIVKKSWCKQRRRKPNEKVQKKFNLNFKKLNKKKILGRNLLPILSLDVVMNLI